MLPADVVDRGRRVLAVCNACRYCEQYCPVFPALEQRRTIEPADLTYLANLCHNCGECLYACQYAPPHEFGINVPRTLAEIRSRSYEECSWPTALGAAFERNSVRTAMAVLAFVSAALALAAIAPRQALWPSDGSADFYGVISHDAMVAIFGTIFLFALLALAVSGVRFWRAAAAGHARSPSATWRVARDVLTLRHLHGRDPGCTSDLEARTPWRRWFHHCTFYGFASCFASTAVAAIYHGVFGWRAPYDYTSLPVVLGTAGGLGLIVGPAGLAWLRRTRDPMLTDERSAGLDAGLLWLLFLTSLTGLALLALRHSPAMGILLIVHLGAVAALFVTLPYGKFVHGMYRLLALIRYHREDSL